MIIITMIIVVKGLLVRDVQPKRWKYIVGSILIIEGVERLIMTAIIIMVEICI